MSKNILAGYFTDSSTDQGSSDICGRTFFDVISECKDFNEDQRTYDQTYDDIYDTWPLPECFKDLGHTTPVQFDQDFVFAFQAPLIDPIKQMVTKYYGEQEAAKRLLPNAETVIADINGLQILIKCGCLRSAINLTEKILRDLATNNRKKMFSPYSLQIWFFRIACLMKLKLFNEAETELAQFENFNKPQYFYNFQPVAYPNRIGCMIPFGLRMLNAELSGYLGKADDSIAYLSKLLVDVNNILDTFKGNENAWKIWCVRKSKVLYSLANILINRKNYEKALETLNKILNTPHMDKCSVWSCIGKLFIQMGNLKDASDSFVKAKNFSRDDSKEDKTRILINGSLIKIANSLYREAYELLLEASLLVPNNPTIINNMAFCLFYSGNLKDSIILIEKFIGNNPNKNVNESIVFNLCTLYELESAKAQQKKLKLLLWLNVYAGDGFYETCLQL